MCGGCKLYHLFKEVRRGVGELEASATKHDEDANTRNCHF